MYDFLLGSLFRRRGFLSDGAAGNRQAIAIQQLGVDEPLRDQGGSTRGVKIGSDEASSGF